MRIDEIKISNYKGVKNIHVTGLANDAVAVISGKNGTGKSLILEAVVAVWSSSTFDESPVGPWGDHSSVQLKIHLTEEERKALKNWGATIPGNTGEIEDDPTISRYWGKDGNTYGHMNRSPAIEMLQHPRFTALYGFSKMDIIQANRNVSISRSLPSVDLGMFGEKRLTEQRESQFEAITKWRHPYNIGDALTYLATIDYLDQIATRSGGESTDEYERIATNFHAATGKKIDKPKLDANHGVTISVNAPHMGEHPISELSVGEHEVLNLMYLVRRLSARGGILLLDEPEQHLHPTLQVALFETMTTMADRAQILTVSHSPSLIASIPSSSTFDMSLANTEKTSQLSRVSEDRQRAELLHELGLRPSALVQSDALIVVEGNDDELILNSLFPIEASRCRFMVAGDVDEAMNACRTLEGVDNLLPWLCVRDRDLLDDAELDELRAKHPNLHVWDRRMIENELLDFELIGETFKRAGAEQTTDEITACLREIAGELKHEVLVELTKKELGKVLIEPNHKSKDPFDKLESYYELKVASFTNKLANFDSAKASVIAEIEERWDNEWLTLAHGKGLLGRLVSKSPFRSKDHLIAALAGTFAQGACRPTSLDRFGLRIDELLNGPRPGSATK
ncbi:Predicted ATP-binding protein involved in virulence [Actinokineospora alba]|uniref:Predicted ATP-binding protein involved in virulence n=1 Tax=Actinokineospora alba TaxID=504798 RepID=A0A1H0WQW1_9PSEU|nr:AAA family ATPase [Actinokineospora alba]TDP65443.1 putative ATP-binding protein involved in virulence [Actinokineospora alba]SDH62361.1 Predicted ATP-binding protein involved in virulence [Actinokineospora alba]SDP92656.1 Predicted ATP-binding protein involved in virulence [Actinokineospora alba]